MWSATSAQQGCLKQSSHEYKLVSVLLSHAETKIPVNPVKLQEEHQLCRQATAAPFRNMLAVLHEEQQLSPGLSSLKSLQNPVF